MFHRIYAIMVKEFRQVRRDTRTLGLLVFVPAFLLALYGYALTFDVKHIEIVTLDADRSPESRELIGGLFHSEYFDLVGTISEPGEADQWLDAGKARAVLIIPAGFGRKIGRGEPGDVQVLVDGANANSASIARSYLEAKVREFSLAKVRVSARRQGFTLPAQPITVEPRIWYNPTLESSQFLVPGIIGFLLMLVGTISTALSVVREKERNTIEQIVVSAVRPAEFIIGKTLPYLLISLVTEALIIASAMALFGMPLRGSIAWLFVASVVFLVGSLGLGLLISSIAETQQVAFQIAVLATLLPSFILSDLIFPIASMPRPLQIVTYLIPPRHFIVIARSVILKGTGPEAWLVPFLALAAFGLAMLAIASRRLGARMRRA